MSRLITSSNSAKVPGDLDALANAARYSRPTPAFNEARTASNDRDVVRLKRCTSIASIAIQFFLSRESLERAIPARNRHLSLQMMPSISTNSAAYLTNYSLTWNTDQY